MTVKIAANQSEVAYHVIDGPFLFPYIADARSAVSRFPAEWSLEPWSVEAEQKARKDTGAPELELTPEDQAELDAHAKAVAEANERLKAYHEKKEAERAERAQVEADEAIVKSVPPRPDPNVRRPFGRKGEPTPAELAAIQKKKDDKAAGDKAAADKAAQDNIAASNAKFTG